MLSYIIYNMTDKGQRKKKCDINGCEKYGRSLATMGDIEIAYCPYHRKKYGERIINALINSLFNYKLSNFLLSVKTDIFMDDVFLCDECKVKLKKYIISKTEEMEETLKYQKDNDANTIIMS